MVCRWHAVCLTLEQQLRQMTVHFWLDRIKKHRCYEILWEVRSKTASLWCDLKNPYSRKCDKKGGTVCDMSLTVISYWKSRCTWEVISNWYEYTSIASSCGLKWSQNNPLVQKNIPTGNYHRALSMNHKPSSWNNTSEKVLLEIARKWLEWPFPVTSL